MQLNVAVCTIERDARVCVHGTQTKLLSNEGKVHPSFAEAFCLLSLVLDSSLQKLLAFMLWPAAQSQGILCVLMRTIFPKLRCSMADVGFCGRVLCAGTAFSAVALHSACRSLVTTACKVIPTISATSSGKVSEVCAVSESCITLVQRVLVSEFQLY